MHLILEGKNLLILGLAMLIASIIALAIGMWIHRRRKQRLKNIFAAEFGEEYH